MVTNPFADGLSVKIDADTSGFEGGISGALQQLRSFRTQIGLAGAAMAALSAGGLAVATKAAADFEEQMVEVEKVTDPETAAAMSDEIRRMAGEIPVAQEELAGITAQAGRFGVEGTENINRFTRAVAEMSVATDLSTEQAGEAFARMTTLLDEPVSNVRNIGSAVNELSNTMATSASEITNASTRSAGALSQLGLQSDEILALNAAMNEVSASSRIAGTRLRRFGQELQDPGKAEDLAAALGMTADEFTRMRDESPNQLMELMVKRFAEGGESADALRSTLSTTSRQALAGLAQNMDGLADAQQAANDQLEDGGSLTEEFRAASSTFNAQLQVMRNRVRNVGIEIGEQVLPIASRFLKRLNGLIQRFSEFNSRTNGVAGTLALVSGVVGGLVVAVGALLPVLTAAGGGIATVAAGLAALAAPITIAVAAVAALAVAWQRNFGNIRGITRRTFTKIRKLWALHGGPLMNEIQLILNKVRSFWKKWGDEIELVVKAAFKVLSTIVVGVLDTILSATRATLALLRGDWKEAFSIIAGLVDRQLGRVTDLLEDLWDWLTDTFDPVDAIVGAFRDVKSKLVGEGGVIPSLVEAVKEAFMGVGEAIANSVKNAFNAAIPDTVELPEVSVGDKTFGGQSISLPQLDTGGFIKDGGLAVLDAGERVLSAAQVDRNDGGGGGMTVNIDRIEASGTQEGRDAGRALVSELRSAGLR